MGATGRGTRYRPGLGRPGALTRTIATAGRVMDRRAPFAFRGIGNAAISRATVRKPSRTYP
jgi:hypothetical protein